VNAAREKLDDAVAAGRLTRSQADEMLDGLRDRIQSLVNSTRPPGRPQFRFRDFDHDSGPAA
jgi:hypothetical protein